MWKCDAMLGCCATLQYWETTPGSCFCGRVGVRGALVLTGYALEGDGCGVYSLSRNAPLVASARRAAPHLPRRFLSAAVSSASPNPGSGTSVCFFHNLNRVTPLICSACIVIKSVKFSLQATARLNLPAGYDDGPVFFTT